MDNTTQKLVNFAERLRFEDLSPTTIEAAKARILGSLGVSLAACDMEPVRIARAVAPSVSTGPQATLFGSLDKTTPDMAAFVNSAMVRALDMNDAYVMAAVSHPSDVFPAVLAVAEAAGASGRDLLLATVLAYEAQCRFVDVVPTSHRGWDQTPVVALGAALGCGRLLGLTREQLAHAISLAVVPNIALNQARTGSLSMWKGMAGPQGARAGVFAAYLAQAGMTGADGVFEGKYGVWNQLFKGEVFDLPIPELPAALPGHTFAVQQSAIKSFPIRMGCHAPVFATLELRKAVDVHEIASLKIESIRQSFERWMDVPEVWKPQTRETADHSLPCTVAMGLLDGTITPAMMEAGRYMDADVLALMGRCTIELPEDFAAAFPKVRNCRLTATLKNGETRVIEYRRTMQDDAADTGWEPSAQLMRDLTTGLLDAAAQEKLIAATAILDQAPRVDALVALTAFKRPH